MPMTSRHNFLSFLEPKFPKENLFETEKNELKQFMTRNKDVEIKTFLFSG